MRAIFLSFVLILLATAGIALGQSGVNLENLRQALQAGKEFWKSEPILNENTGSYYQFVYDAGGGGRTNGVRWEKAFVKAQQMTLRDREGRLAKVDSQELYKWILRRWDLRGLGYGGRTWIGLRYWCPYRQLTWTSGEDHSFDAFGAWDTPWYRPDGIRCSTGANLPYMGVYIEGATGRWRATGYKKVFPYYLVEYPPPPKEAQTSKER